MLAIYEQLIPPHDSLRKPLYVVIAITVGSALAALFSDSFWCGPNLSVNWYGASRLLRVRKDVADVTDRSHDLPGDCSIFTSYSLFRPLWSLCFTCEVLSKKNHSQLAVCHLLMPQFSSCRFPSC